MDIQERKRRLENIIKNIEEQKNMLKENEISLQECLDDVYNDIKYFRDALYHYIESLPDRKRIPLRDKYTGLDEILDNTNIDVKRSNSTIEDINYILDNSIKELKNIEE